MGTRLGLIATLFSLLCTMPAAANPVVSTDISIIDTMFRETIELEERRGYSDLVRQLGKDGYGRLHAEFSRFAGPSAKDSICTILRERLPSSHQDINPEVPSKWNRAEVCSLVVCAEVLSYYRDTMAIPRIASAIALLSSVPHESLRVSFRTMSPTWFLEQAIRRIKDPGSTIVFGPISPDTGHFRAYKNESDIEGLRITVDNGYRPEWHWALPDPVRDRRILVHLSSCRPGEKGPLHIRHKRLAAMEIVFRDGCVATIDLTMSGIRYRDNTQYFNAQYWLYCEDLVGDMWKLAEQFEDLVEIW